MKFASRVQTTEGRRSLKLSKALLAAALAVGCARAQAQEVDNRAGEWRITPRISLGSTYSDNIRLAPANAEHDLLFHVDPGLSVRKRGGRLDLRLDYTAQGLLYTNNGDASTINNELQAFGTAELLQKNLFLDAYGLISQVAVSSNGRTDAGNLGSAGGVPSGLSVFSNFDLGLPGGRDLFNPLTIFNDIALTDNQATGYRFGISPYWRQNLGGWADVLLRYRYDTVFYDEESNVDPQQPDVRTTTGDSQINTVELNLTSGRQSSKVRWNVAYFYQQEQQDNQQTVNALANGDDKQEHATAQLNYQLDKEWALLGEAGYENNQVTGFANSPDGTYWGLGAVWTPSRFLEVKGLYGPDVNELSGRWNPSTRTNLRISRRKQDFGVDPGVRWQGLFNHRTRASVWSLAYTDEVTNERQLFGNGLLGVGPDGQPLPLSDQGQAVATEGPFGLSNRNFRRKRFDAGMTYRRGSTDWSINAFNEDRTGQNTTDDEKIYGAGALWTWRFAPRTASFIGTGWERDELGENQQGQVQNNEYWVSVIGLARAFTPDAGGLISYRYYENDADPAERGFRENRLNIRFNMKF
ncbi:MAG: TIGR03016 family PEP-CTERM system-associated outer membrane protein [Candidatus Competibacteraceae bacterium]|nr:TIGR03016 family PEP-CTERM system-associated outer membrane protein [Candidatus Competibacteraceae bacterium]MBK7982653.1 TIGR03016 family PEP-CTERM system-associated outer membrane protein [Candidatus Competibacteraceae bacterium]MBK9951815.1 TIGR03016 family PEP-CTERM system-associated outer membrane protein [Candidatus Competibacteraceae bacterium]